MGEEQWGSSSPVVHQWWVQWKGQGINSLHGFERTQGGLIVNFKYRRSRNSNMTFSLFSVQGNRRVFNPDLKAAQVHDCLRFAALKDLSVLDKSFKWKTIGFGMYILTIRKRPDHVSSLILLYGWSCNNLTALVHSHVRFLDTLNTILTFARTFETEYAVSFSESRKSHIIKDLQASSILQSVTTTSFLRIYLLQSFCCGIPMLSAILKWKCPMSSG